MFFVYSTFKSSPTSVGSLMNSEVAFNSTSSDTAHFKFTPIASSCSGLSLCFKVGKSWRKSLTKTHTYPSYNLQMPEWTKSLHNSMNCEVHITFLAGLAAIANPSDHQLCKWTLIASSDLLELNGKLLFMSFVKWITQIKDSFVSFHQWSVISNFEMVYSHRRWNSELGLFCTKRSES